METLIIIPFKPLGIDLPDDQPHNASYIWNVKCTFIACDDEDEEGCKLDDTCAGRYNTIKSSSNNQGRKRRSGDGQTAHSYTAEKTVEHPCAYATDHTSLCDGHGENCWTQDVCHRIYNSSAVSALSSALVVLSLFLK